MANHWSHAAGGCRPIRRSQRPVRNVSQRGSGRCFRTSACRYPRSHTNVGDVGNMAGMGVQRIMLEGQRTWTVTGEDHLPVGPVEEFLEFLRVAQPVLAEHDPLVCHIAGPLVGVPGRGRAGVGRGERCRCSSPFVASLRTGHPAGVTAAARCRCAGQPGGVDGRGAGRGSAVVLPISRRCPSGAGGWAALPGGQAGGPLCARAGAPAAGPGSGRVRRSGYAAAASRPVPVLTPPQVEAILEECARWDAGDGQWAGSVRDRLLFATLAETGMRLGEALSTRHCDWHAGRGGTPFIEVVPRQDHPAGVR